MWISGWWHVWLMRLREDVIPKGLRHMRWPGWALLRYYPCLAGDWPGGRTPGCPAFGIFRIKCLWKSCFPWILRIWRTDMYRSFVPGSGRIRIREDGGFISWYTALKRSYDLSCPWPAGFCWPHRCFCCRPERTAVR